MDEIGNNQNNEFYKEFDRFYGCKVVPNSNMTRKQFCDLIVNEVAGADYVLPLDLNDVQAIFNHVQIVDAAVFNCSISDISTTINDIVCCFKKHHKQANIRYLMFLILISKSEEITMGKMYGLLNELADEIGRHDEQADYISGFAKDEKLEPGQIRIISGAGLYYDVKEEKVKIKISRKLAYLLRHTDFIDCQGFCSVKHAMDYCGITEEELRYIVEHDNKNRFEIVGDSVVEGRIRARNGHSGKVRIDPGLKIASPPSTLYHATSNEKALDHILYKKEGLKSMSRQYVQLTECPEVALEAAKRHKKSSPVLLEINAHTAFCCGIHFYLTTNGIWQVEHIPYYYIRIADNLSKR